MAEVIEIGPIQKKDNRKKRVCAYARVSSDSDDQLNSFSVQVEHYTGFISQNPAWEFVDIYADEGLTGLRADKRGEFQRRGNAPAGGIAHHANAVKGQDKRLRRP